MTPEALQSLLKKAAPGVRVVGIGKAEGSHKKTSKYRSQRVEMDGIKFDSKKEAARYFELLLMQKMGIISGLERQVVYQLSVCKYVADYVYFDKQGNKIVEDVKSTMTRKLQVYRLKKKLMAHELGITIREY